MFKKEVLIEAQPQLNANIGEDIGYELGAKMIKDYFDKYQEGGSYLVGRNILEEILNQPSCEGIRIFNALNEKGEKVHVIVGYDNNAKAILEITTVTPTGDLEQKNGIVADRGGRTGWFDDLVIK